MAKKMKKKCNPGRKVIKIPAHLEKEAYLYAGQYVKNVLGVHERDPEFKQVVDKAAKRFLTDTYKHSLTPHVKTDKNGVSPNPYKVSETVPFAADFVNVKNEIGKFSTAEQKIRWATFYSSVASVVHSFLKLKFKWKAEDLDASGKPQTSMPPMEKGISEDKRQAINHRVFRNRYIRQVTNVVTVMIIDELFAVGGEQITAVAEAILDKYETVDLLTRGTNRMILKRIVDQLGGFDFATEINDKLAEIAVNIGNSPVSATGEKMAAVEEGKEVPLSDYGDTSSKRVAEEGQMLRLTAGETIDAVQKEMAKGRRKTDKVATKSVKSQWGNFKLIGPEKLTGRIKAIFEKLGGIDTLHNPDDFEEFKNKHKSAKFILEQLRIGRTVIAVEDVLEAVVKPNPRARETEGKNRKHNPKRLKKKDFM